MRIAAVLEPTQVSPTKRASGTGARTLTPRDVLLATGVTRKALRLYEEKGLLTQPSRTYNGQRRYSTRTIEEVRFIRSAIGVGLSLRDIRPALTAWRSGSSTCTPLTPALNRRIVQIEDQLQVLRRQRAALEALRQDCDCDRDCAGDAVCGAMTKAG